VRPGVGIFIQPAQHHTALVLARGYPCESGFGRWRRWRRLVIASPIRTSSRR
jgi:hypothetical protein